ncbi:hypothetical protein MKX68_06385 [Paenibacillus sp. FSL M8-0212]|uniref:hypothetical protein n=1 Tax=Paenibacillus sp. FSL M8-0212 TaxID=2921618 RepID=UPI0030F54484
MRIVGDAVGCYEIDWDAATRMVLLVSKGGETETVQTGGRGATENVLDMGHTRNGTTLKRSHLQRDVYASGRHFEEK